MSTTSKKKTYLKIWQEFKNNGLLHSQDIGNNGYLHDVPKNDERRHMESTKTLTTTLMFSNKNIL